MLEGDKLPVYDFSIDDNRFEVAKLVLEFTFLVLPSEKVDAILHQITLNKQTISSVSDEHLGSLNSQLTCLLSSWD